MRWTHQPGPSLIVCCTSGQEVLRHFCLKEQLDRLHGAFQRTLKISKHMLVQIERQTDGQTDQQSHIRTLHLTFSKIIFGLSAESRVSVTHRLGSTGWISPSFQFSLGCNGAVCNILEDLLAGSVDLKWKKKMHCVHVLTFKFISSVGALVRRRWTYCTMTIKPGSNTLLV